MDKYVIVGGNRLNGKVKIGGMKNAIVHMMPATLLASGKSRLDNVPELADVRTMADLLRIVGAKVHWEDHTLVIDTSSCDHPEAPYELVKTMRASFCILGPLLARFGQARVSLPGGCVLGPRPVNFHIDGMKALGAEIEIDQGYVVAKAKKLVGAKIKFDVPSMGGTANVMMAAVTAKGTTVLENAARDPELIATANFLTKMGARISGAGTNRIEIEGVDFLSTAYDRIISDRLEAATFLMAAAITGGTVEVQDCVPEHLTSVLQALERSGVKIKAMENSILIEEPERLRGTDITTQPYPGYATDNQPLHASLMSVADGRSIITDTVYPERFIYAAELRRLGADIVEEGNRAIVNGVKNLSGAHVMASDIRGGAALILAGLVAQGETNISRIYHIERGYEKIEEKLQGLGANIVRERE